MKPLYIIITLTIVFTIYFIFLFIMTKGSNKRKLNEVGNFILDENLTSLQKQGIGYSMILSRYRCENNITSYEIPKNFNYNEYVLGLSKQWGIDKNNAKEYLSNFLSNNYVNDKYDLDSKNKLRDKLIKKLKLDYSTYSQFNSIYGWDVVRFAALIKWCFWIGYINEDELNEYLVEVNLVVKENGYDWNELALSFLLGRTLSGFDLGDIIDDARMVINNKSFRDFLDSIEFK